MAARTTRGGAEWVGGLVKLPAYVTGEGEPYRPDLLIWMAAEGAVLGFSTGKPGELLAGAGARLRETMQSPMFGPPRAPSRVRVASSELATVLRETLPPRIELLCGPTPEIDDVLAIMGEKIVDGAETGQSYLSPGTSAKAVSAFFRAAAGLFRARPWEVIPSDQSLLSITIEQLQVQGAAMSVIGQMGESLGFILFSGLDDFEAYLAASSAIERGEQPRIPPHVALNFERGADLTGVLRKEIAKHGWEVAARDAFPWLVAVDEDLVARPPVPRELAIAEAISLALPHVLSEEAGLLAAWTGGPSVTRTVRVGTHAGEVEVTVVAPFQEEHLRKRAPGDLLADLADLESDGDEIDGRARRALEDEIVRRFLESPEASALSEVGSCHFVMNFAADYFGATIVTLGPAQLREIVFEIIPRKVSIDASRASWIIEENRALYAFMKRELGLAQADACLRVLGGKAVEQLEAALSDRQNFGMAKSVWMAGRDAGFDMSSKEGIEAFMRVTQGKPLPVGFPSPAALPPRRPDRAAAGHRKNQRKAARKARKKGR